MKKSVLIALIVGALLVIAAIVLFSSGKNPVQEKEPTKKIEFQLPAGDSSDAESEEDDVVEDETEEPEEEVIPEATVEDIQAAVLDGGEEADKKFLTTQQLRELNSASLTASKPEPRKEQTFTLEWKDTEFSEKTPTLPEEAPVYLLDRPTEESTFDSLRTLAENLGIRGAVLRSNRKNYSVADIAKGEYYLTYDMYHLMFDASVMNAPVEGSVKETMENWGLLAFPSTEEIVMDRRDRQWYKYVPELDLPILTMARVEADGEFQPDKLGEVHVLSDGKRITRIISRFPNIEEKDVLPLLSSEGMAESLSEAEFVLGDVILQYPGALPIEEKRSFYEYSRGENVTVGEAELDRVECGYLLEEDNVLQAILSPACMAHGKGKIDGNSVIFRVVFPAVQ